MRHPAIRLFGEILDGVQEADSDVLWTLAQFVESMRERTGGFSDELIEACGDALFYGDVPSEHLRAWQAGEVLRAAGIEVPPLRERMRSLRQLNGPAGTRGEQHPGGGE